MKKLINLTVQVEVTHKSNTGFDGIIEDTIHDIRRDMESAGWNCLSNMYNAYIPTGEDSEERVPIKAEVMMVDVEDVDEE